MVAAYVGQMAPSSRIAVTALFQCGDEIRRIQRIACRVAQIARACPDIIAAGRTLWQSDPSWQPLRRAVERLLVAYDWGEALIGLNVCVKPVVDDLFLGALADRADQSEGHLDAQILRSLFEDCRWHRAWTDALLALALSDNAANGPVIARWIEKWTPVFDECVVAAANVVGTHPAAGSAGARARLLVHRPAATVGVVSNG
jgi:hypothetical protein